MTHGPGADGLVGRIADERLLAEESASLPAGVGRPEVIPPSTVRGRLVGLGSGQTSRVDAARQAVAKAAAISGPEALRGAACASDAFFPFADGVEACLEHGVTAFVQPGGSVRDAEVVATVDKAGATMLVTGRRHFRH